MAVSPHVSARAVLAHLVPREVRPVLGVSFGNFPVLTSSA